jgi:hypothetical protein
VDPKGELAPPTASAAGYTPPPKSTAPPHGWQPPRIVEPAAPRVLPVQDHAAIDAGEERARILTRGVGVVAAVLLAILLLLVCGQAIL